MTFDQAKEAFREHKTCGSADAYLHNAVQGGRPDRRPGLVQRRWRGGKLARGIRSAIAELRSGQSQRPCLAQIVEEVTLQAQIIRFPIERCRPRQSEGIETFMLAPIAFYLRMTSMF
jgi:hypothetical protein